MSKNNCGAKSSSYKAPKAPAGKTAKAVKPAAEGKGNGKTQKVKPAGSTAAPAAPKTRAETVTNIQRRERILKAFLKTKQEMTRKELLPYVKSELGIRNMCRDLVTEGLLRLATADEGSIELKWGMTAKGRQAALKIK